MSEQSGVKQNPLLPTDKTCVTIAANGDNPMRTLFLGLRQSLLMQISADDKAYNERRAAFFLQLAELENFLDVERTKKR
jgi:hypothetical protein